MSEFRRFRKAESLKRNLANRGLPPRQDLTQCRELRIPTRRRASPGREIGNRYEGGLNGAGGGNRTHGLGIMRPSLYH
jgi:hypothetical protein